MVASFNKSSNGPNARASSKISLVIFFLISKEEINPPASVEMILEMTRSALSLKARILSWL